LKSNAGEQAMSKGFHDTVVDADASHAGWLVHIGYPKAASTFLQSVLFSGLNPAFVPYSGDPNGPTPKKPGTDLIMDGTGRTRASQPFAFDLEARRRQLQSAERKLGTVTVLSNEEFTGHPFSGGVSADTIGLRIKTLLPDARILIVIREQRAMALSTYAHYLVASKGRMALRWFLAPELQAQIPLHTPEYYRFSRLVGWYRSAFGSDRVMVLPMEALIRDPEAAERRISDFAGVRYSPVATPPEKVRTNRRDYRRYAALRMFPGINRWARPNPANGYTGRNIPGLRDGLLALCSAGIPQALVDTILARDRARIEASLAPIAGPHNLLLQKYVEDDLATYGYLMGGMD
jgi:hypothetical protein